jgi:hypothetical protein
MSLYIGFRNKKCLHQLHRCILIYQAHKTGIYIKLFKCKLKYKLYLANPPELFSETSVLQLSSENVWKFSGKIFDHATFWVSNRLYIEDVCILQYSLRNVPLKIHLHTVPSYTSIPPICLQSMLLNYEGHLHIYYTSKEYKKKTSIYKYA